MDLPPPPTVDPKPTVQHHATVTQPKTDLQWGRPIFRAPELQSFAPRKKDGVFKQPPFKGRVREKRAA